MSAAPLLSPGSAPGSAQDESAPDAPGRPRADRRRLALTVLVVLSVVLALVISIARGFYRDGLLEPDSPTPQGSRAVVQVLEDLDHPTSTVRFTSEAARSLEAGGTVLVASPSSLSQQQIDALRDASSAGDGTLILVAPDPVTLSEATGAIQPAGRIEEGQRIDPGPCDDPALDSPAAALELRGEDAAAGASRLYRPGPGATACAPATASTSEGGYLLVSEGNLIVLGSAELLTNEGVGEADNSALALHLLGGGPSLTWYMPSPNDPMATDGESLLTHLPDWAGPALLWLLLLGVVAVVVAGRRLGPVVVEPLPVSVRPQELVLGRARMLQRSDSREAAATALRSATCVRLAEMLGLRRSDSVEVLLAALRAHTDRSPADLRRLLAPDGTAPAPADDRQLVQLASDLDQLVKEIDR